MAKNWFYKTKQRTGMSNLDMLTARKAAEEAAQKYERQAHEKAIHRALGISLSVLAADYWQKTAKKKAPQFVKSFLSAYESVLLGVMTDEEIAEFLEDVAGMHIQADWLKGKYHCEEET